DSLAQRLDLPVRVENDATSAAWAERQVGAARGLDDVVLVTLGTGIGGGVVAGGVLQRGAHGFAGEVGHMVVDPDGPECPCGKRGGLFAMGDLLFTPLRAAFDGLVLGARYRPHVTIVQAALGDHAGAVGAGLLAREVL